METQKLDIHLILPPDFRECERCVERLRAALLHLNGMRAVEFHPDDSSLVLTYDRSALTVERVEEEARQIGVSIVEKFSHESFEIKGIDCPDCALKIEKGVGQLPGVVFASLNYATSDLFVEYEPGKLERSRIVRRVRDLGYDVVERVAPGAERPSRPIWWERKVVFTAASGMLLLAGIGASVTAPHAAKLLWSLSLIFGGVYVVRTGILGLRAFSVDTNLLVTLAAAGAIALGNFRDAATVLFLFSLGSALESYTVNRARNSIWELVRLFPAQATVSRNGVETQVTLDQIAVGDTLIVRPGDRIATDGFVARGSSWVNESPITGESAPVEKTELSEVYAGTLNDRGYLEVTATRTVADNTLSRIIHLVEEAQAQKAPSQRFSERFGRIYTPVVIALAACVALFPTVALRMPLESWLPKALTLLVVACPCALVISTPVAIASAIGNAAKRGFLVNGGAYLEALGGLRVMAFDKTGTLTYGQLEVVDVLATAGSTRREVLSLAASVEQHSEHPLARAVLKRADEEGITPEHVGSFEAIPGKGASAMRGDETWRVCSDRFLKELDIPVEAGPAQEEAIRGKTVLYACRDTRVIGLIALQDAPRPRTDEVMRSLRESGIRKTVMLTGDSRLAAEGVAAQIGIDEIRAQLLPEDKVTAVNDLLREHKSVAMVGDGINDAPALAAATVGIAMGGAGTHAVLETADVVLMADDLSKLPFGVRLSRKALRIIRFNTFFSVAVVIVLVAGAASGRLHLAGGVIGHEGSALIVILNGMRLLRYSPSEHKC